MGYNIQLIHSTVKIKPENLDKVYKVMCALNDKDDLKHGGQYPEANSPRPKDMNYHPYKWFAWMLPDYPSKCKNAREIFTELGFDVDEKDDGELHIISYDSKAGDEDIFLRACAPYMEGVMQWRGEDEQMWGQKFVEGKPPLSLTCKMKWVENDA